jgi:hypothetical protein
MISVLVVIAGLVVPGFLPSLWLTRCPLPALALAPMVTGLACALGSVVALVTRTALLPWVVVVVVATNLAVVLQATKGQSKPESGAVDADRFSFRSVVPFALVAAPLLTVRQAPHAWDARSIWWFHADWFWSGGDVLARALQNPIFVFSHPDYPPLAPATIATLWRLRGGSDLEFAQLVSAILTAAPVVLLAMAVGGRFAGTASRWVGTAASVLVLLAVHGGTKVMGTDGYVDLQWAVAFSAAAVVILLWPPEPRHVAVGAIALAYAGLTKNEGMLSAVVLLALAAFRFRHRRQLLVFPAVATAAGFVWMVVARMHGAESDLASGPTAAKWLRGDFVGFERLHPTLTAVWNVGRGTMAPAALMLVLGVVFLRRDRHRLGIPGAGYLWLAAAGAQLLIVLAYVISPDPLDWHLGSSLTRTMLVVQLLLLVEMVVWFGVAMAVASDRRLARMSAVSEVSALSATDR